MILSKRNLFVRAYRWIWSAYPTNFCALFWTSLLNVLAVFGWINLMINFLSAWRFFVISFIALSTIVILWQFFRLGKRRAVQFIKDSSAVIQNRYCTKIEITE